MLLYNLYASSKTDGFIFGEKAKRFPYKLSFPFKHEVVVSYYPSLKYINYVEAPDNFQKFCIGYSGKLNADKGIFNILKALKIVLVQNPQLELKLKIIGWFASSDDKGKFYNEISKIERLELELLEYQDFKNFSNKLADVNLFIDLRQLDFEYNHSLPIKIFFYAACGRPVIYSNIKAIRKNVNIKDFGFLVNPNDYNNVARLIVGYIENKVLYTEHCYNARKLAVHYYNWENIESLFLNYIQKF